MIEDLLIEFDEMGFAPTTLCETPEKYAVEWKKRLVAEIDKFQTALFKQEETMQIIAKEKQQYFDELQIAQEVVRCKDCKYFSEEIQHCNILGFCEPNEYCSRGERRKEDDKSRTD